MPDTRTIQDIIRDVATTTNVDVAEAGQFLARGTMLQVSPTAADTAKVAAFLVSDLSRTVTGTMVMSEIR